MRVNQVSGVYDPKKAQHKARDRRRGARYQGMKIVVCPALRKYVEQYLYEGQSPEMIAGRLKCIATHLPYVSPRSIRRYLKTVYGRKIEVHRQQQRKTPRKGKRRFINDSKRMNIHDRPHYINTRASLGDAEADFIVSGRNGNGRVLVVVDRKSRMVFLEKIQSPSCTTVHYAFVCIKKRFPEMKSITLDNDILFQKHTELATLLQVQIYFCDPYSSWQKGTVENTNRHIRKYLPKGTNLATCTTPQLRDIEEKLNSRIMKIFSVSYPY